MVKYLCVAEKPSISKSITQILSGGHFQSRNAARGPNFIKNYDFSYRMPPNQAFVDFTVTAVAGHLTSQSFGDLDKWHACDPFQLFDCPIKQFTTPEPNQIGIEKNLIAEAKKATHLMIWTDCDREGEHIGSEIAAVCRKANNRIVVKRARFSAIIPNQINNACRNPVELDMRQANAVAARMELDLRVGAALTRTQTLGLQNKVAGLEESIISYGPCQFPTLGFVVDQYNRMQQFVPEAFWYIQVSLTREGSTVIFSWKRGRLYDRDAVEAIFSLLEDEPEATVIRNDTKPTQKWKPLPLTTVELQKTGSRLLRLPPKSILDISDSLYQRGILSYPRTETDQFDKDFNFEELIQKHTGDAAWGQFAQNLVNGAFERPRNGSKNDQAHPPIHPTAHVSNLAGEEKRVYDLVVRRFLACCSTNAKGMQTSVDIDIAGEVFSAQGLVVLERNYLDVYIYDKWDGNLLPEFEVGETFEPTACEVKEGETTRPSLLTEADLVSLMDKNGIGTDATIAEHIANIIKREYVMKNKIGAVEYLLPSTLGIGLVEGYNTIGFDNSLTKPTLRRLTEIRMVDICEGRKTKREVIEETLDEYREMFIRTRHDFATLIESVRRYVEGDGGDVDDSDDDQQGGHGGQAPRGGGRGGRARGARGAGVGGGGGRGGGGGGGGDARGGGGAGGGNSSRGGGAQRGARGAGRGGSHARGRQREPSPPDDLDDDELKDPRDGGGAAIPVCKCDEPAVERTVNKEGPNKGRKFFGCQKGMNDSCGFFAWSEEGGAGPAKIVPQKRQSNDSNNYHSQQRQPKVARADASNGESRRCNCDLTASIKTVTKEGPNNGKQFYTWLTRSLEVLFQAVPIPGRTEFQAVPASTVARAVTFHHIVLPRLLGHQEVAGVMEEKVNASFASRRDIGPALVLSAGTTTEAEGLRTSRASNAGLLGTLRTHVPIQILDLDQVLKPVVAVALPEEGEVEEGARESFDYESIEL
ncbi:prokaryotic type I DNA topoisomerase [Meredithblackwellia eburnea MCA 4105]